MTTVNDLKLEFTIKNKSAADILSMAGKLGCSNERVLAIALELLQATIGHQKSGFDVGAFNLKTNTFIKFAGIDKESIAAQRSKGEA